MKDASIVFTKMEDDLSREFDLMYDTYTKIFTRLGLNLEQ